MAEDREWADFLDRLIHDVREPLRSIHAFSELLREIAPDRLGAEGMEATGQVLSGTARIRQLMEGIAEYSVALRETDTPDPGPASLQLAFEMAVDRLAEQIRQCGANVVAEGLPRVNVSLQRLMRLLENLVGNSLKFRGDVPPVIHVTAAPDGDGWNIQVRDNGIGIDASDSESVFQPFTRVHGRKYPGVGLGLAVCRKIIEAHGGEIRIGPREGGGAICSFWLPSA